MLLGLPLTLLLLKGLPRGSGGEPGGAPPPAALYGAVAAVFGLSIRCGGRG